MCECLRNSDFKEKSNADWQFTLRQILFQCYKIIVKKGCCRADNTAQLVECLPSIRWVVSSISSAIQTHVVTHTWNPSTVIILEGRMGWGRTETELEKDNGTIETFPPSLSLLLLPCLCARVYSCTITTCRHHRKTCGVLPSTTWILGMELKSSGSKASGFTHCTNLSAHSVCFLQSRTELLECCCPMT